MGARTVSSRRKSIDDDESGQGVNMESVRGLESSVLDEDEIDGGATTA